LASTQSAILRIAKLESTQTTFSTKQEARYFHRNKASKSY
jgi:hypothetical protein